MASFFYIFTALSAGTILYVVVFEVLQRERSKNINGMATFFAAVLGFVAMLLVEIFGASTFPILMRILGQKNA